MKKISSLSIILLTIGLTGCVNTEKETATPKTEKAPIMVLGEEALPGKNAVGAAKNVRDLANDSLNKIDRLLKESQ